MARLAQQGLTLPSPSLHQMKDSAPPLFEEDQEASAWLEATRLQMCPLCAHQANT